jgi:hypothetical protein
MLSGYVELLHLSKERDLPKPDDSKSTAGHDDKVAEVVAEGHTSKNGERGMELERVS